MGIVTFFYLSTNFVIFGAVPSSQLAGTAVPLVLVSAALLGATGAAFTSAGALVSVSGSDESGMLGTARLTYAMSVDGLFQVLLQSPSKIQHALRSANSSRRNCACPIPLLRSWRPHIVLRLQSRLLITQRFADGLGPRNAWLA